MSHQAFVLFGVFLAQFIGERAFGQGVIHSISSLTGGGVVGLDDIDADGCREFAVASFFGPSGSVAVVRVYSGATGSMLYQFDPLYPNDALGVAEGGDFDLDGFGDILVGSSGSMAGVSGYVQVRSGRTGSILKSWTGSSLSEKFGAEFATPGDVDQDGTSDVLIGVPFAPGGGSIRIYAGLTGAFMKSVSPTSAAVTHLPYRAVGLGDVNGDGFDDFAYSANQGSGSSAFSIVDVVDGNSSVVLFGVNSGQTNDQFGQYALAAGQDIDGDGKFDFIVGARWHGVNKSGAAWVFSGVNGHVIHHIDSLSQSGEYGRSVSLTDDVNNDGRADFIVSDTWGTNQQFGWVRVYSGATGIVLAQINGAVDHESLGLSVASVGDVNGDGYADIAAAGYNITRVYSIWCGGLTSFGTGCPNIAGFIPELSVNQGCYSPSVEISLALNAQVGAGFLAAIAVSPFNVPVALGPNCSLYPGVNSFILPISIGIFGITVVNAKIPIGYVGPIVMQGFVAAPGMPLGVSATKAILIDVQ